MPCALGGIRRCGAEAIGIDVRRVHWIGFAIAGTFGGAAGGLFAFAKGTISPDLAWVSRSLDAMVMVLLGGHPDTERPDRGRSRIYLVAGYDHAPDRLSGMGSLAW